MYDHERTNFCVGLKLEHCADGIIIHKLNCILKMLRHLNEDKVKPLSTPMIVHSLEGSYHPADDDDEILEPEVPYLSIISALLYLTKCARLDISFTVNLLARYSYAPTRSR